MSKTLTVKFDVSNLTNEQIDYLRISLEVQGEDIPHVNQDGDADYGHSSDRVDATHIESKVE
jgi:hypothetical protein